MIKNYNVEYMYSDSREVDESLEFQQYVNQLILEAGTIKVFELKLPDKQTDR